MKNNKALIFALVLTFGCVIVAVLSGKKVSETKKELDAERYYKIMAEEKLSQVQSKVNSLESELSRKQTQIDNVQSLLEKEKVTASEIRNQMDKVLQLNRQLEETLKNAVSPMNAELPEAEGP